MYTQRIYTYSCWKALSFSHQWYKLWIGFQAVYVFHLDERQRIDKMNTSHKVFLLHLKVLDEIELCSHIPSLRQDFSILFYPSSVTTAESVPHNIHTPYNPGLVKYRDKALLMNIEIDLPQLTAVDSCWPAPYRIFHHISYSRVF